MHRILYLSPTMFEIFQKNAIDAIMRTQKEVFACKQNCLTAEMMLLGILLQEKENDKVPKFLRTLEINVDTYRSDYLSLAPTWTFGKANVEVPFTQEAKDALQYAKKVCGEDLHTGHLIQGILVHGDFVKELLQKQGLRVEQVMEKTFAEEKQLVIAGPEQEITETNILEDLGVNLTQQAKDGKLDPITGRVQEMERVMQILCRRGKCNACLVGAPGVGKTAMVEGLAQRIADGNVPHTLQGKQVISLDLALLLSETSYRGQFEERMKKLMQAIKKQGNVILFIDEIHMMVHAGSTSGSAMDMANILKPALARGDFQCIGATTHAEYETYIQKDGALSRRFQQVHLEAPSSKDTLAMLRVLRVQYEEHHQVKYNDNALTEAVDFAAKHIPDRAFPDKAIDLIDEAGSRAQFYGRKKVTKQDIQAVGKLYAGNH